MPIKQTHEPTAEHFERMAALCQRMADAAQAMCDVWNETGEEEMNGACSPTFLQCIPMSIDDWSFQLTAARDEWRAKAQIARQPAPLADALRIPVTDLTSAKVWLDALAAAGSDFHLDDDPSTIIKGGSGGHLLFRREDHEFIREQVKAVHAQDWREYRDAHSYQFGRDNPPKLSAREMLAPFGFVPACTGGNCWAWQAVNAAGDEIDICTEDSGCIGDALQQYWAAGVFRKGDEIDSTEPALMTVPQILAYFGGNGHLIGVRKP